MVHRRKESDSVSILSKVFIIKHNGKDYYLLDYPQGKFLLTKSEYYSSDVMSMGKDLFSVKMSYPTRDKSYYRFIEYFDTKPTFRKKVEERLR